MFMGTYDHSLDAKGRVIVPAKFRDELGDAFVATPGFDGCLYLYTMEEWKNFAEKLKKLPNTKEGRKMERFFASGASACEVDKQGRFLLPGKLRDAAGLSKDIVFVGVMSKIEVWSKERWDDNDDYDNVDDIAENMAELGIDF